MIGTRVQMPKGDKDEGVQKWLHDLDRGIQLREKHEKRWERNERFEDMAQYADATGGVREGSDDEVTVNKVGSFVRTYRAQISFNDPRAKLVPRTSDGHMPVPVPVIGPGGQPTGEMRQVVKAAVREALLNDILEAPLHNTQAVNSRLVKAGLLGWGCLKAGYDPTFRTEPEKDGDQELRITEDGRLDLSEFERNSVTGDLVMTDDSRLIRRDMIPIYEDFFIRWVPYRNMIIDPDGGNDWSEHRWVAEEWVRPLAEVKDDPLFKNTKDLKASGYRKSKDDGTVEWHSAENEWAGVDEEIRRDAEVVRGFEIYDTVNERLIVLADGHGKYLRDDPLPLGVTGHPYSDFRPNEVIGQFYQRPLLTDLVPINMWFNESKKYEQRAMRRSTRKVLARKGYLTSDNLAALASDEDLEVIEVDVRGNMSGLADAVAYIASPPVPDSVYANANSAERAFDEVGGISEAGRGNATGGTATETNVMEQYSGRRIDFDRKVLAETWRRAIKKLNDSLDANMTTSRAIRLEGSDGQVFVGEVDRDLIAGDFDVVVNVEDMAPTNSAVEGAQLVQFIQTLGQSVWIVADETLAREFLSKFGVKNERVVQALSKAAQMQIQMMMAPAAPGPAPNAPPPGNEADAIAQAGAGMQAPRMSGAT